LQLAFERGESRVQATDALRGLLDSIILMPGGKASRFLLKGNLAGHASGSPNATRLPEQATSMRSNAGCGARRRYL
jgi:hypothetical protein